MKPETQKRVDRLCQAAWNGRISPESLRGLVLATLKEQDRDTRHACAEAVCFSTVERAIPEVNDAITRAHGACINTVAV